MYNAGMTVNLSIRKVPQSLAQKLRECAKLHHRSLQGEVMHILEQNVQTLEQKTEIRALERRHREGYRGKPVKSGEFDAWHGEQAWGDD